MNPLQEVAEGFFKLLEALPAILAGVLITGALLGGGIVALLWWWLG